MPNLVAGDDDLTEANSLLIGVENLAWVIGPVVAGVIVAAFGPDPAYWINAATFAFSAALVARIPARRLSPRNRSPAATGATFAKGSRSSLRAPQLRTVLLVWNVVIVGNAAVNVRRSSSRRSPSVPAAPGSGSSSPRAASA